MRKKTFLIFSIFASAIFSAGILFPQTTFACDTLEKVTVDGISYTRVRSTFDPCPATEAPQSAPGIVLAANATATPGNSTSGIPQIPAGLQGQITAPDVSSLTGSGSSKTQTETTTLGAAKQFDCGDPSQGGTLAQAFGSALNGIVGRIGSESLSGIFGGWEGGGSSLDGIFSSIGDSVTGAAGNYVEGAIGEAFGDSQLGQAAGQIVGNVASDWIQENGGNAISGALGSIGIGEIGGFGGGSGGIVDSVSGIFGGGGGISDIAGGVAGIGGGKVPVAESKLQQIGEQTKAIVDQTRALTKTIDERS